MGARADRVRIRLSEGSGNLSGHGRDSATEGIEICLQFASYVYGWFRRGIKCIFHSSYMASTNSQGVEGQGEVPVTEKVEVGELYTTV